MTQTSFHRTTGKPGRSPRLHLEVLEARDMPSTLPVPVHPTLPAAWRAPALVRVSEPAASAGLTALKAQVNTNAAGSRGANSYLLGAVNVDLSHGSPVRFSIARSSGEEIPQ
jgi:hypothetical protein